MKLRILWVSVLLASLVSFVHAELDPMNLPSLTQYVTDFAGVLSSDQQTSLESLAQSYDQQTSNQIVAVLIPNRKWNEIFDIGMKIFNTNTVWQSAKNNGLLLVISTEEKKIRIIVWYGLEWQIPDLLASRIIEEDVRPLVDKGDFAWAIRAFYDRSISAISTDEAATIQSSSSDYLSNDDFKMFLFVGFMFTALIFPSFLKILRYKTKKAKHPEVSNRSFWKIIPILIFWGLAFYLSVFIIGTFVLFLWVLIGSIVGFISYFFWNTFGGMWSRGWFGWGFGWGGFGWWDFGWWGWFGGWGGFSGWGWAGD